MPLTGREEVDKSVFEIDLLPAQRQDRVFASTMLAAFAEIAEIERETIVTRVKAGLYAAKQRGVVLGAPRKIDDEASEQIRQMHASGLSYRKIAESCGVSLGSVAKIIKNTCENKLQE